MVAKLEVLRHGLKMWACSKRRDRCKLKNELSTKLEMLIEVDHTDGVLDDLIDTRICLNWEMEQEEIY